MRAKQKLSSIDDLLIGPSDDLLRAQLSDNSKSNKGKKPKLAGTHTPTLPIGIEIRS